MRQALCLGLMLLLSFVFSGCGQVMSAAPQVNQPAAGALSLTELHDLGEFQARFNQDAGKPRLVLLVSPT